MKRVLLLVVCLSFASPVWANETDEGAKKLTNLSNVNVSEREKTHGRFRFILGEIVRLCEDAPKVAGVVNAFIVLEKVLKEAGIDEPLPKLAESLHTLAQDMKVYALLANEKLKCSPGFLVYVMMRQEGKSPARAVRVATNGMATSTMLDLLKQEKK